jgi:hypothetical protein
MRVGREKASLNAQTARQRAAEAAARAEAERTARPKRDVLISPIYAAGAACWKLFLNTLRTYTHIHR